MGWYDSIFGSSSSSSSSKNSTDPLGKLDPKLREFLEKESPVKLQKEQEEERRRQEKQQQLQQQQQQQQQIQAEAAKTTTTTTDDNGGAVPKESLYQDGRYAHLWKGYRPLAELEHEAKSDHEKLQDVLEGFKARKAQIGRAALENCALEQLDWRNCMNEGSWDAKLTMCSRQVKKFERCYTMQSRLLKTLGYLSTYDRPASVDEDIQMHADALYHRMVEQEEAVERAKAANQPVPQFAPLAVRPMVPAADDPTENLTAEARQNMLARLAKVPEEDRAMEEEAIKAEMRAKAEIATKVQAIWKENETEREKRRREGQETVLEKFASMWRGGGGGGGGEESK